MFPHRASDGDRATLPPISSLSSHQGDAAAASRADSARFPLRADEPGRERLPPPALEHRQTPPSALLQRPQPPRDMEPLRAGPYSRPGDEAYATPHNLKLAHHGPPPPPPPPFHRDLEHGAPPTDEAAWRSYDRPDPHFGAKDAYSPNMPPAPYASRDDARSAPWQRPSDDPHRPRMPAPPVAMRDDGPWRPGAPPRGRADNMHPDAYAHDRLRDEDRWRRERPARHMYPCENGPGFAGGVPPYPHDAHARGAGRPMEADAAEDGRRIRRRATMSLMEDEPMGPRYPPPGARPYRPGTYSPPESRRQSAAPNQAASRPGTMAGMEPPCPSSTLGVMPSAAAASSGVAPPASSTTNTVNANRRVAHLLSEQKRRESINTGFEDLRQAIPACRDGQDSKATILKRALEYIRELESVVERQHRPPLEGHVFGGYSNRSPPDDKDDLRRFGRPGGEEDRRGASSGRQMTGGSSSSSSGSDAGNAPRIGGRPSTAYASAPSSQGYNSSASASASAPAAHRMREFRSYDSPHLSPPSVDGAAQAEADVRGPPTAKRWADDSDEDQRSPSRRRVSDGDKDDMHRSPAGPNYLIARPPTAAAAAAVHSRSPLLRSPKMEHPPRDWQARLENKSLVDSAVRV
ncbi:uncharacterized protein SRS1_15203 [Sporisorium reilianum f. sp. reilianum]|uniref:BHLH domain-containing protein n=1 Tax=Sporisorium reilianum f. sp. reilianum TaxID=72559 RepID=A0A2N8UJ99_9BASI|nr:uncharacterized protein SRS1_15203 [Sporisorium reilianum f. sp. reilianum]